MRAVASGGEERPPNPRDSAGAGSALSVPARGWLAPAICIAAFINCSSVAEGLTGPDSQLALQGLSGTLGACALVWSALRGGWNSHNALFWLFAFLLVSAASAIATHSLLLAFQALGTTIIFVAAYAAAERAALTGHDNRLSVAVVVALAFAATSAILEAYAGLALSRPGRSPGGLVGNRNQLAALLVIGLPTLIAAGFAAKRVLLHGAALFLFTVPIVLSRSRAAWLTSLGLVAIVVFILSSRRVEPRAWRRVFALALFCLGGLVVALSVPNRLSWTVANPYADTVKRLLDYETGSGAGRIRQWTVGLSAIRDNPILGAGTGNWSVFAWPYTMAKEEENVALIRDMDAALPSSDWLAVAAERGLLAAVCLTAFYIALIRKGAQRHGALPNRPTVVATAFSVAAIGCFDTLITLPAGALVSGILLGGSSWHNERATNDWPKRPLLAAMFAIALICSSASASTLASLHIISHWNNPTRIDRASRVFPGHFGLQVFAAASWLRAGDCQRALLKAAHAHEVHPYRPEPMNLSRPCMNGWWDLGPRDLRADEQKD